MSDSSSGGIGLGTIIFLVVMYNVIFDDDDEKQVEVIKQDTTVQTAPAPTNDIKESLRKVKTDGVVLLKNIKKEALSIKDEAIKQIELRKEKKEKEKITNPLPTEELKSTTTSNPEVDQLNEKSNESDDTMIKL